MGAWRYWRAYITADNGGGGIDLYEIKLTVGGVNKTGTGTASASSSFSGFTPAGAFDGNTTTRWASDFSGVYPQWIAYDFGAGNDQALDGMSWMPASATSRAPKAFQLQASADGSTWYDVLVQTGLTTGWSLSVYRDFTFTAPDQTLVPAQAPIAAELEFHETYGGADVATSAQAFGTQKDGLRPPASAFDNDTSTVWCGADTTGLAATDYIGQDFGSGNSKNINELAYTPGAYYATAISAGHVQWSDDKSAWTTAWDFTTAVFSGPTESQTLVNPSIGELLGVIPAAATITGTLNSVPAAMLAGTIAAAPTVAGSLLLSSPMADPASITYDTHATALTGSVTIAVPATCEVGDLMLAWIVIEANTQTLSTPAGWTLADSVVDSSKLCSGFLYWKPYETTDTAFTWNLSGTACAIGAITRVTGADLGNPIDAIGHDGSSSDSGTPSSTSITTTVQNSLVVACGGFGGYGPFGNIAAPLTAPTGFGMDFMQKYNAAGGSNPLGPISSAIAAAVQASPGSTGSLNFGVYTNIILLVNIRHAGMSGAVLAKPSLVGMLTAPQAGDGGNSNAIDLGSTTIAIPTETADGDLLVAHVVWGQNGAPSGFAGWTLLDTYSSAGREAAILWRWWRTGDPTSFAFDADGDTIPIGVHIWDVKGASATHPFYGTAGFSRNNVENAIRIITAGSSSYADLFLTAVSCTGVKTLTPNSTVVPDYSQNYSGAEGFTMVGGHGFIQALSSMTYGVWSISELADAVGWFIIINQPSAAELPHPTA